MKYKDINDYYLIDTICEKNDFSYGILFDKYKPLVKNEASSFYLKYSNYGYEYDDFVQEAYVALSKAIRCYDANRDALFFTFVSVCVRRHLISFVKRISSGHIKYVFVPLEYIDLYLDYNIKNDDEFDYEDVIKEVIYDSNIEYSSVLELKYNDFTYKEISILLDIKYSQVEYRFRKIRELIKDKIVNL